MAKTNSVIAEQAADFLHFLLLIFKRDVLEINNKCYTNQPQGFYAIYEIINRNAHDIICYIRTRRGHGFSVQPE